MTRDSLKVVAVSFALILAGPAAADDHLRFQSPTGNIHCAMHSFDGTSEARCDLRQYMPSCTRCPAGCDPDRGMAFAVGATGKRVLACVGDMVQDRGNPVLPCGEAVSLGGTSCVSTKTGMTCANAEGNGFGVRKARQKLF